MKGKELSRASIQGKPLGIEQNVVRESGRRWKALRAGRVRRRKSEWEMEQRRERLLPGPGRDSHRHR